MSADKKWTLGRIADNAIGFLFLPVILLLVGPIVAAHYVRGVFLRQKWIHQYGRVGKPVLLVYSQSPNWQVYIEANWLPRLRERAVVLDWSHRASWKRPFPLEVKAFRHWGGESEFNPMAVVFPRRGKVRTIRFWQPFRDFKHGKVETLQAAEKELFEFMDRLETAV